MHTYSLVALVDKAEGEERERIYRERAGGRQRSRSEWEARGEGHAGNMRGTPISVGGAQKHFNERKAREPRANEPEREEKGSP